MYWIWENWVKIYKLYGTKSQDYHMLLQYILSISIKGTQSKKIEQGVYHLHHNLGGFIIVELLKMRFCFGRLRTLKQCAHFKFVCPPTFFNIMPHFVAYLAKEVELYGLVQARWLYFLERFTTHLRNFVQQKPILKVAWVRAVWQRRQSFCGKFLPWVYTKLKNV